MGGLLLLLMGGEGWMFGSDISVTKRNEFFDSARGMGLDVMSGIVNRLAFFFLFPILQSSRTIETRQTTAKRGEKGGNLENIYRTHRYTVI